MRRPSIGMIAACAVVVGSIAVVLRHASAGVTRGGLEGAVAPTFANLVHLQRSILGLPAEPASAMRAAARCQRVGAAKEADGPGDWTCTVNWYSGWAQLHDGYDVSVTADGCYTATADGAEAHIGGPTLTGRDGTTVTNLLYTFEGCFDTRRNAR